MKKLLLLNLLLLNFTFLNAQSNIIVYEDFETVGIDNWTLYTNSTPDYWNLSVDDGINGSSCARCIPDIFNTPFPANDSWIISPEFITSSFDSIGFNFSSRMYEEGIGLEIYYSIDYIGDVSSASWIKLDSIYHSNYDWTESVDYSIKNSGNNIRIAFRYQSTTTECNWWLIDEINLFEFDINILVGESDHFEYYSSISNALVISEISENLEKNYQKYCTEWNRPGQSIALDNETVKIKVFYGEKSEFSFEDISTSPDWKCGYYDPDKMELYLCKIETEEQQKYYVDINGLAIHTFGTYALKKRQERDGSDYLPDYFEEGFGLYELGYRPNRDSIINYRDLNSENLSYTDINNIDDITQNNKKDLVVSYVEGQILCYLGYRYCAPDYSSYTAIWNNYLTHFYDTTDAVQIKLYHTCENFDVYCSSRDTMYTEIISDWMERTLLYYKDSFEMEFNTRFHICIYYDEQTGIEMTGFDNFNGGAGALNISPHNFYDGIKGYPFLIAHEFGHVFNDFMYHEFPFGFYHEGMANFSAFNVFGSDWSDGKWKIDYVFDYYQNNYSREPTLDDFINNPDADDPDFYGIDPYFFGFEFIRYIYGEYGIIKLKEFFNGGLNYNIFDKSYAEIETGYINYLKNINNNTDPTLDVNNLLTVIIGKSQIINSSYLSASDAESDNSEIEFILTDLPIYGQIEHLDYQGIAISSFTQQQLLDEKIQYVHDNSDSKSDYFNFYISDGIFNLEFLTFNISISETTEINNASQNQFNIWPTLINDEVNIKSEQLINELKIYDITGKCFLNKIVNSNDTQINCTNLKSGMYIFIVTTNQNSYVNRLIKK